MSSGDKDIEPLQGTFNLIMLRAVRSSAKPACSDRAPAGPWT
jgi:hypothetical protein